MDSVSVADAKAHLSELLDRVEDGASVDIPRRGKPIARLTTAKSPRKPIDMAALRAFTSSMPMQAQSAEDLVRDIRDSDRY